MTSPKPLKERLLLVLAAGNLTVMDLARWLDRPHPTVRQWTKGTAMSGPPQDNQAVLHMLYRLEMAVQYKKGFPVPRLRPRDRRAYLAKVRKRVAPPMAG